MKIKNIGYFFREALTSLSRNRLLSIATVSTMAISIFFLGVAVLLTVNADRFMNRLESDIEIVAFLNDSANKTQVAAINDQIQALAGVQAVVFVYKDQALARIQDKFATDNYDLGKTLGKNPLPDTYEIKAQKPQDVPVLAGQIGTIPGVYKVSYGQGVVEKLFQVTKWVRIISVSLMGLLAMGSVFLIATTIRLSIYARRKEIYLMKLIGATDWFVRWPFFIEGVILGLAGALIAIGTLGVGYNSLVSSLATTLFFVPLVQQQNLLINMYLSLLGAGAVLGILGTYISLNRFLDI
ncbi:MAG: permease-like cell division protein FtsX [Firmicutes bacterium]|nr:permease-like cell division protein FtsX [Bacillota bacterium]